MTAETDLTEAPPCPPWCTTKYDDHGGWELDGGDLMKDCWSRDYKAAGDRGRREYTVNVRQFASVEDGSVELSIVLDDSTLTPNEADTLADLLRECARIARTG